MVFFALVLLLCMALLVPNLQTVPNLSAGTVPGGKTVSTFGKTFLQQLSKSSLFLIKSDWHEFFPNTSIAILLLYSGQLTHMRGPYQFRNLTTFVLKHVVIPWSQIHLPNAHVSEESLTETFCDFLSWSTAPSTWKRRVHSFTPAFNLENIQIHKYANKHKHRHTNTNTIQVQDAKRRTLINIYIKTRWMKDRFTISFGLGLWSNKYKCTWQLVAISEQKPMLEEEDIQCIV